MAESSCCCPTVDVPNDDYNKYRRIPGSDASVNSAAGGIPQVPTRLSMIDIFAGWMVRWSFRRMDYRVKPGLYAVGTPNAESEILVTANYKMSLDSLRRQLGGRHLWLLVLDTKGVNVWCAAGKGTFGTEELVSRIEKTELKKIVSHRKLILPQLGAPGIAAHDVARRSGFKVIYGPVRAADLPACLDNRMKVLPEMRRVSFPLRDRLVLVPIELVATFKYALALVIILFLLSAAQRGGFGLAVMDGLHIVALLAVAIFAGVLLTPALLPWIPGRTFAAKGAWTGLVMASATVVCVLTGGGLFANWLMASGWFMIIPAIASFLAMNFTGASTYTSLSGVRAEMRIAVPLQVGTGLAGLGLWLGGLFL